MASNMYICTIKFDMKTTVVLCLFVFIAFSSFSQLDEKGFTDGTKMELKDQGITIVPPKGYKYKKSTPGFISMSHQASIHLQRIENAAYFYTIASIEHTDYSKQPVKLLGKEEVEGGAIFTFQFKVQDKSVERLVLVTGTKNSTVIISVNYEKGADSNTEKELRDCLKSVAVLR